MTPRKKKSVRTDVACSVSKVCTHTLLMTVCSTSNIRETRRDKINTGSCWNNFSEFRSLESSDSEQRVKGGQPGRTRKTTGKPEEACGRYRCSSVNPDRFPPFLRQAWWYVVSIRLGRGRHRSCQSRLFIPYLYPTPITRQTLHVNRFVSQCVSFPGQLQLKGASP